MKELIKILNEIKEQEQEYKFNWNEFDKYKAEGVIGNFSRNVRVVKFKIGKDYSLIQRFRTIVGNSLRKEKKRTLELVEQYLKAD